jgi:hypothetical protein
MSTKPSTEPNFETSDTNPGALVLWGVAVVGLLLFSVVATWVVFNVLSAAADRNDRKPSPLASNDLPPGPRLITDEPKDLAEIRKENEEILDSYGWVDKERGLVRIPIEKAMSMVVKEAAKHAEAGS